MVIRGLPDAPFIPLMQTYTPAHKPRLDLKPQPQALRTIAGRIEERTYRELIAIADRRRISLSKLVQSFVIEGLAREAQR